MQIESNSLERHAVAKNNIEETNIVIGKGSYGSVSLIRINGTLCIKKSLHQILLGIGGHSRVSSDKRSSLLDKFLKECDLLFRLHHPNIV